MKSTMTSSQTSLATSKKLSMSLDELIQKEGYKSGSTKTPVRNAGLSGARGADGIAGSTSGKFVRRGPSILGNGGSHLNGTLRRLQANAVKSAPIIIHRDNALAKGIGNQKSPIPRISNIRQSVNTRQVVINSSSMKAQTAMDSNVGGYAVMVSGVSPQTTENVLKSHFGQCGKILSISITKPGTAIIYFDSKHAANTAVQNLGESRVDRVIVKVRPYGGKADGRVATVMPMIRRAPQPYECFDNRREMEDQYFHYDSRIRDENITSMYTPNARPPFYDGRHVAHMDSYNHYQTAVLPPPLTHRAPPQNAVAPRDSFVQRETVRHASTPVRYTVPTLTNGPSGTTITKTSGFSSSARSSGPGIHPEDSNAMTDIPPTTLRSRRDNLEHQNYSNDFDEFEDSYHEESPNMDARAAAPRRKRLEATAPASQAGRNFGSQNRPGTAVKRRSDRSDDDEPQDSEVPSGSSRGRNISSRDNRMDSKISTKSSNRDARGESRNSLYKETKTSKRPERSRDVSDTQQGATVIVSNVPFDLTATELQDAFSTVGHVVRTEIMLNSSGDSSGRAIIVFGSKRLAEEAVRRFDGGDLNENTIRVLLE